MAQIFERRRESDRIVALQMLLDRLDQQVAADGLREEAIAASRARTLLVLAARMRGQRDHRNRASGPLLEPPRRFPAVEALALQAGYGPIGGELITLRVPCSR